MNYSLWSKSDYIEHKIMRVESASIMGGRKIEYNNLIKIILY